jgi:uncharacterized MAPEG superfamily protein
MTTPFWCLLVVVFIPYVLSTITGYVRVRQFGTLDNKNPRAQAAQLEGVGARLVAAQQNAWEALAVFSAAVIVAHVTGADPDKSATAAIVFVCARVVHAVAYATNVDVVRSISFLVGAACALWLFLLAGG